MSYQQQDEGHNINGSVNVNNTVTSTIITGLMVGATYSMNIVATSNTLPSPETTAPDITIGILSIVYLLLLKHYFLHFIKSLSVPQPDVVINVNPTGQLYYTGTSLTLTCTVSLDPSLNNNENGNIEWSGLQSIPEDRYSVSDVVRGFGCNYIATLKISPLVVLDSEVTIACTGTLTDTYDFVS